MNFGSIGQDNNPTGFTNNWNIERSHENLFAYKYSDYSLYAPEETQVDLRFHNRSDVLGNIVESSPLSKLFFSSNNIKHLKYLLAKFIKQKTNYAINPEYQSDNELLIVMRSIFLQNAENRSDEIGKQCIDLNYLVLEDLYPRTVSKIQHYLCYVREHGSRPLPHEYPKNMSNKGTKTHMSIPDKLLM
jgi:hypothetical protein